MKVALLIIDMLNPLDFPQGQRLAQLALPVAQHILSLKQRIIKRQGLVVYCNDNFGHWDSDANKIFKIAVESPQGLSLARILKPNPGDLFVLKPEYSAFHHTALDNVLNYYQVTHLILTGIAGNLCVLFTAMDAHMQKYKLWVPADCIASNTLRENKIAIAELKSMKALVAQSSSNYFFK